MIQQELNLCNTEAPHYMPHFPANGFELYNEEDIETAYGATVEHHKVLDPVIANWLDHIYFILPDDIGNRNAKTHFETEFSKFTDSDLVNNVQYYDDDKGGWNLIVTTITF